MSGSSTFSGHSDGSNTSRNTVQALNEFALGPNWYAAGILDFLNSEQQDLNLRTTVGAALGRWFKRTQQVSWAGVAGLVYTHETYSTPPTLNLEIAHNLYWSFTLYENYDSKPPVNANKNDFGVTNSLGWKF